jgi:SAM-dependent methyltransferase
VETLYDTIGTHYGNYRRPDPRISAALNAEFGQAASIVNIGAGVGSYAPRDREIVAVEPSWLMISQRAKSGPPVVQARAESLPFRDAAFDVATAILTIHHWSNIERGLQEARRVARDRIVFLTRSGFGQDFWLLDYLPQIREIEEPLFPSIEELARLLGPVRVIPVPIPHDCMDGFLCAYWQRPHSYLNEGVRSAISTFSRVLDIDEGLRRLKEDLETRAWHNRYGRLFQTDSMDCGYRLVVWQREAA